LKLSMLFIVETLMYVDAEIELLGIGTISILEN
jgi:hypothetical protein